MVINLIYEIKVTTRRKVIPEVVDRRTKHTATKRRIRKFAIKFIMKNMQLFYVTYNIFHGVSYS